MQESKRYKRCCKWSLKPGYERTIALIDYELLYHLNMRVRRDFQGQTNMKCYRIRAINFPINVNKKVNGNRECCGAAFFFVRFAKLIKCTRKILTIAHFTAHAISDSLLIFFCIYFLNFYMLSLFDLLCIHFSSKCYMLFRRKCSPGY